MLFKADTGLRPVRFKSHVPPYKCFCLSQPAFPLFLGAGLLMKENIKIPGEQLPKMAGAEKRILKKALRAG